MNLTSLDVADLAGVQLILDALQKRWPWVKHIFGDAADDRRTLMGKAQCMNFTIEIVRQLED